MGGEGFAATFVFAGCFGQGDAFALAFADEGAFEFSEGAHDLKEEALEGVAALCAHEGEVLLVEDDRDAFAGELVDGFLEVGEIAGEAVDAVDVEGIALTQPGEAGFELGAIGIAAAAGVGEGLFEWDGFQLSGGGLIEGGDAQVADVLPWHAVCPGCGFGFVRRDCQDRY